MPDAEIDFASLLCSRLCHDLMSPIGALGNGLELLADETDEGMRAKCLELVGDSARASADRLKFFRVAFGAATGLGDSVPAGELKAAVEGLVRGNARIALNWLVEPASLDKVAAKILLNLSLIASETLVRGGTLDVAAEAGEVVVRATGGRLVLDAEVRAVLAGAAGTQAPDSRTAVAWLVRQLAQKAGGRVMLADEEQGVIVLAASLSG